MEKPKRIIVTTRAPKRLRVVSSAKRISPARVARALGGKVVGKSHPRAVDPIGLFALREEVSRLLQSTGGRPALEGVEERQKIPLMKGDWEKLKTIAARAEAEGARPSPGQVASLLLHRAIGEALGLRGRRGPLKERNLDAK